MPARFVIISQIENNLSMFAKDTSLRDSMREEFQVCPYPLMKRYNWILAQCFSTGFACGTKIFLFYKYSLIKG